MRTLFLLLPILLAACDSGSVTPTAAPSPQGPSDIQQRIARLEEPQRNAVFIRAIRDAGFDCQQVTASQPQPDASASGQVWTARCSGGAAYAVVIGRDGTAQVVGAR